MERIVYVAKPKKRPSQEVIKKRQLQREVREILREHAKDQAGRGGISPEKKREINKITRTTPS
ncbi:hypothetical protein A2954_05210 [Candidatus Roizmanbacteria bacterium RIFCSPLOWO2_01_FULL_37_12]|uniref:Uncharacterized protein n=1 Tax=Candidatus Roizmanbacteria bacterium RIFCSPLOWO2_01_FULL_37_12 TaxID=1802056 RepID=A0A1F7I8W2_9BACT|nr:MAG: hypothetical protein A2768_02305 [Candidatus Roizmanbacteria bacterium RIFCSPHIGHO2_01_FULL_37_16]OGK23023.1 MAG: hypothetical protein A3D76_06510 [Candidatus Roizmanbacteria bacterium RIFCSPHIGHO2_02_FULL_37_9b]OGK39793.1 MAG: hypothetical protein A2954_05210 [Candidatus Roizmanbacteria bacterium RIFCSPLOWO2_01_FULL_37_12]